MESFVCDLDIAPAPGHFKEFKVGPLEVLVSNIDGKFLLRTQDVHTQVGLHYRKAP
jgi:hypothetical protein